MEELKTATGLTQVLNILSEYGWYILFSCIAVYYMLQRINGVLQSRSHKRTQASEAQLEPSLIMRRQEAMDAARHRMQQELDAQAAKYREKQKEIEEEKRREKIEAWENMQEGKSFRKRTNLHPESESSTMSAAKPKSDKKSLRGGFNPLTGDGGGSCSWRPGRRGPSTGA
ncbi:selenoprotein S isoform X1 [Hemiscyllium ocellatum]|uniref:selenoprotein S isoform X1 n=1 Tax=Hemiscyllium ocellatum TaxID=170820 RepID=UPI00296670BE|nr:selenoprotein S isoform X1 [Hemiscyllium ocellatum]